MARTIKGYNGEDNPNWKGAKTITECEQCEKIFEYYPRARNGRFCSHQCLSNHRMRRVLLVCENCKKEFNCCSRKCSGELKHKNSIHHLTCVVCNEEFEVLDNQKHRVYCSLKCWGVARKELLKGENNPRWIGGTTNYRGKEWKMQRRLAVIRDGLKCRRCQEENTRLNVHHIIPYRETADNSLINLITLCNRCHTTVENDYRRIGLNGWMKQQQLNNHDVTEGTEELTGKRYIMFENPDSAWLNEAMETRTDSKM